MYPRLQESYETLGVEIVLMEDLILGHSLSTSLVMDAVLFHMFLMVALQLVDRPGVARGRVVCVSEMFGWIRVL